tara:strand:+ start:480 stop:989 length:510 start_codon:yes stop_codon:yes gene_type:complete
MKSFLDKINIFKKSDSIKNLEKQLKKIDIENEKVREKEIKKQEKRDKFFAELQSKRELLWDTTFYKDKEFANELIVIGKHIKKNTNFDIFIEYHKSSKNINSGCAGFIIHNMNVLLSVRDENTFNVRTYKNNHVTGNDVKSKNFNVKDIEKCKQYFKNEVLALYEKLTS